MRTQTFIHQNRQCRRWEVDGVPPVEVVRDRTSTTYRDREYPTAVEIWKGVHRLDNGRQVWTVDKSATFDAGPKLGIALVYSVHPETPPTEEERRTNRAHLNAVIEQILPGFRLLEQAGAAT